MGRSPVSFVASASGSVPASSSSRAHCASPLKNAARCSAVKPSSVVALASSGGSISAAWTRRARPGGGLEEVEHGAFRQPVGLFPVTAVQRGEDR